MSETKTVVALAHITLPNGDVVMQRRTPDAPTHPNMLGYFGGHLESNETPQAAIHRELREEVSLDIPETLKLLATYTVGDRTAYIYHFPISTFEFEIFEGTAKEHYSSGSLLKRDDLATPSDIKQALKGLKERHDV